MIQVGTTQPNQPRVRELSQGNEGIKEKTDMIRVINIRPLPIPSFPCFLTTIATLSLSVASNLNFPCARVHPSHSGLRAHVPFFNLFVEPAHLFL